MTAKSLYPTIQAVWVAAHEEGNQLELACEVSGQRVYFAKFVADEQDERLSFELSVQGKPVRIPLDRLEELITDARKHVYSESEHLRRLTSDAGS